MFINLAERPGVSHNTLNMCAYGMKDPVSDLYYLKAVTLLHNFPKGSLDPIFRRCPNMETSSHVHDHQKVHQNVAGHGTRASLSQIYPVKFCRKLARLIDNHDQNRHRPLNSCVQTSLMSTIVDDADLSLEELQCLASWSDNDYPESC